MWLTFLVGDLNFVAAIVVVVYVLKDRGALLRSRAAADTPR